MSLWYGNNGFDAGLGGHDPLVAHCGVRGGIGTLRILVRDGGQA